MTFVSKIKEVFSSTPSAADIKDMVEFRRTKIDLLKGEISTLIDDIDRNEDSYLEMKKTTESEIEKGMKDGDSLKEHLEKRYNKRRDELLKSLGSKKVELRRHEDKLAELEKGKRGQVYADSIVRDGEGNILMLLRRGDSEFEPSKWGLPGGKVEIDESPEEGAKRELNEETNLTVSTCYKIAEKTLEDGGCIHYYNVYIKENENWVALDEEEHSNYCFMSLNEIRQRADSDFIMNLRVTLLELLDPISQHYQVLEKAHRDGGLEDEVFSKAKQAYTQFVFQKDRQL